jgi:hypothetical protein
MVFMAVAWQDSGTLDAAIVELSRTATRAGARR